MDVRWMYEKPNEDEMKKRCHWIVKYEAGLIADLFERHGVDAAIDLGSSFTTKQFYVLSVKLYGKETIKRIAALHPEIQLGVSNVRGEETFVRIQDLPLSIEIPLPWPRSIHYVHADWSGIAPRQMIVGMNYSVYHSKRQLVVDFKKQHHVLVAGASGAGKTVILNMMISSYAGQNDPRRSRLWIFDLKGKDLAPFHRLPHVECVATNVEQAEAAMERLYEEVERRRQPGASTEPQIVLVIDEQAEFRNSDRALDLQNTIMAQGRGLGINVVVATQDPTKSAMGKFSIRNMSVRLVGAVTDADAARYATGRPNSGAQYLQRPGGFLYIDGPKTIRFQSYDVPDNSLDVIVNEIRRIWHEKANGFVAERKDASLPVKPVVVGEVVTEYQTSLEADAAKAEDAFNEYYIPEKDKLKHGGKKAIIVAIFGEDTATGGYFDERSGVVFRYLREKRVALVGSDEEGSTSGRETTTTDKVIQMNRKRA